MKTFKVMAVSLLIFSTTMSVIGCDSGLSEVTGKVTLDGKPVKGMEITFEQKDPTNGAAAIGYTQEDGTYKLHYPGDKTGTPTGEYIVRITGGETDETGKPVRVSKQFNADSELTATVESGSNEFNFDVTSK